MTTSSDTRVSAQLMLLVDSRSPAGGHSHSGGMEAAVNAGLVRGLGDVHEFCAGRLRTAGVVAAGFAATSNALWHNGSAPQAWLTLDAEFSARTPSEALRAASRSLGSGLRRLTAATFPDADLATPWALIERPAPHHPLVLGGACALTGADALLTARAAALGVCTAAGSAGVRLLGLDPYAVHTILSALGAEIDRIAATAAAAAAAMAVGSPGWQERLAELPAVSAPALDLLADVHARSEVRLFAS
jgi:urease accessory protein